MKILQELPEELLQEYSLCQEKATGLADNIWKTAAILGVGSVVGIVALSKNDTIPDDLRPWLPIVLSLFAIGILLAWLRLARRWWSIEQTMFRRMEHIERQSLLRANLYVGHLNKRVKFVASQEDGTYIQPFLDSDFLGDLEELRNNYEIRGIQPMMRFVIETNIAAWIAFACFALAARVPARIPVPWTSITFGGPTLVKLLAASFFALWFLWRLRVQWRRE